MDIAAHEVVHKECMHTSSGHMYHMLQAEDTGSAAEAEAHSKVSEKVWQAISAFIGGDCYLWPYLVACFHPCTGRLRFDCLDFSMLALHAKLHIAQRV